MECGLRGQLVDGVGCMWIAWVACGLRGWRVDCVGCMWIAWVAWGLRGMQVDDVGGRWQLYSAGDYGCLYKKSAISLTEWSDYSACILPAQVLSTYALPR